MDSKSTGKKSMADKWAETPIEVLIGLVDIFELQGQSNGDGHWKFLFNFVCWKISGGPIHRQRLWIESPVISEVEYDSMWERIEPFSVVRIRARLAEEPIKGKSKALLVEFLGKDESDAELLQESIEIQKPVVHQDSVFGELKYERQVNWYVGKSIWNGQLVSLYLTLENSTSIDAVLEAAHSLWQNQSEWVKRIEDFAVQELLPLKNRDWLECDEPPLTESDFKDLMKLASVSVASKGSFRFAFQDSDMFRGRSIFVDGNFSDGPTLAELGGTTSDEDQRPIAGVSR